MTKCRVDEDTNEHYAREEEDVRLRNEFDIETDIHEQYEAFVVDDPDLAEAVIIESNAFATYLDMVFKGWKEKNINTY